MLLSSYWGAKSKKDMSPVPNEFAYWRIQLVSKTVNDTDTLSVQPQVTMEVKVGASQQICGIRVLPRETDIYILKSVSKTKSSPPTGKETCLWSPEIIVC